MNVFSDSLVTSLCWTLLHSLWQGALIAIFAASTMIYMKRAKATVRYNILVAALLLFLILTSYTFYSYKASNDIGTPTYTSTNGIVCTDQKDAASIVNTEFDMTSLINENVNIIVGMWFLLFIIKAIVLSRQALHISRLKTIGISALPEAWQEKANALAGEISLHKQYTISLSSYVNTPMVIGLIKPTLLLPFSILNGMPQDQIEAILLHELAHIKRNDYLINVLQRIVELAFFFNPGLMWLSNAIDDEREHACDEMALTIHKDRHSFINALVGFTEYMHSTNKLALGFGNNKKYLLSRAKRILTNQTDGFANYDKSIMALCLMITSVPVINHWANEEVKAIHPIDAKNIEVTAIDTLPVNAESVKIIEEIKQVNIEAEAITKKGTKLDKQQEANLKVLHEKLASLQEKLNLLNEAKLSDINIHLQTYQGHLDSEMSYQAKEETKLQEESRKLDAEAQALKAEEAMLKVEAEKLKAEAESMALDEIRMKEDARRMAADELRMAEDQKRMKQDQKRMEQDHLRMLDDEKRMAIQSQQLSQQSAEIDMRTKNIVEQMLKDKIITSQKNLSFSLGENELIINGKKQSDELMKKYFKMFGINGGKILHNFSIDTNKK